MVICYRYVNVVKELFLHETNITLNGIRFHWMVFVQVKCDDVFKTQAFFSVNSNQLLVDFFR